MWAGSSRTEEHEKNEHERHEITRKARRRHLGEDVSWDSGFSFSWASSSFVSFVIFVMMEGQVLRIASRLDDDLERLVHAVIGHCIVVHKQLGPGLLEAIYRRAICVELERSGLVFECEKRVPVMYRNVALGEQRLDIVVGGQVLLELKAVERLAPIHFAQVMSYLRVSRLRVALLVNFNVRMLPDGLRRIVL